MKTLWVIFNWPAVFKLTKRSFWVSQLGFSFVKEARDCFSINSGCGEIGRRTRFRFWRREAWGFKSLHPHHYFLSNSLKFLQENHLEEKSCHTFRTQSADQAPIIITDVCQNTQFQHMVHSSGNPCLIAQRRLLSMQNV